MPYKIEIYETDIVLVQFSGQSDFEENIRAREEVVRLNHRHGFSKILADWRASEVAPEVSTLKLYEFGRSWPQSRSSPFRIAIVQSKNAKSQKDIAFSEAVASNRGVLSKIFWEFDAALSWLQGPEPTAE